MKNLFFVITLGILFVIGAFFWLESNKAAVDLNDKTSQEFIVSANDTLTTIATNLAQKKLIHNSFVFTLLVKQRGLEGKMQSGTFRLSPSMSSGEIAQTISEGPQDIWVTIPEGKRAAEIAEILQQKIPSYAPSWAALLEQKEGYLFPDTYLLPKDVTIDTVLSLFSDNFAKKYFLAQSEQTSSLTKEQAVILASIVEREGRSATEMKQVASVLENRLHMGMALQVDATIQYALGFQNKDQSWWKKTLTSQDLQINSPYNTYLNPGLPPTPIANPGLNALTAVLHPATTSYLYYYTDPHGITHFARTLDEHNANIQTYSH